MGISGLLLALKPLSKDVHISCFQGKSIGVDTYCWLHKAVYSCSMELCQGMETDKYIRYCFEMVDMLLYYGVTPFLVFDGSFLPAKAGKEVERKQRREESLAQARQNLKIGNMTAARGYFAKAVEVTPYMAFRLIEALREDRPSVKIVVAPYEADAQLGYLCQNGKVSAVITEDSDTLLYGCSPVLFKLDKQTGVGQMLSNEDIFSKPISSDLDFRDLDKEMFLWICILSGCDYLPSVKGVGLKKAYTLVRRHRDLGRLIRALRFEMGTAVPPTYEQDFRLAILTFLHQTVFDVDKRTLVPLTPFGVLEHGDMDYVGPLLTEEIGCLIADAKIDPVTHVPFSNKKTADADCPALFKRSSVSRSYNADVSKQSKASVSQKNTLKSYWSKTVSKRALSKDNSEDDECEVVDPGSDLYFEKISQAMKKTALQKQNSSSELSSLNVGLDERKQECSDVSPISFYSLGTAGPYEAEPSSTQTDETRISDSISSQFESSQDDSKVASSNDPDSENQALNCEEVMSARPVLSKHFVVGSATVSGLPGGILRRRRTMEATSATTTFRASRSVKSFGGFECPKQAVLALNELKAEYRGIALSASAPITKTALPNTGLEENVEDFYSFAYDPSQVLLGSDNTLKENSDAENEHPNVNASMSISNKKCTKKVPIRSRIKNGVPSNTCDQILATKNQASSTEMKLSAHSCIDLKTINFENFAFIK